MSKFPVDAKKEKVLDGTITPMTIPNHPRIKSSTLRTICNQAGIKREDFINAFNK